MTWFEYFPYKIGTHQHGGAWIDTSSLEEKMRYKKQQKDKPGQGSSSDSSSSKEISEGLEEREVLKNRLKYLLCELAEIIQKTGQSLSK